MKNKIFNLFLFLLFCAIIFLSSCSEKDQDLFQNNEPKVRNEILTFGTKELFLQTLNAVEGTSLRNSQNLYGLSVGNSLYDRNEYKEYLYEYIPNENFAKLLNIESEIIVENTVYKITPNGTYYFSIDKKDVFDRMYSYDSLILGNPIGDKLYEIADGILLI